MQGQCWDPGLQRNSWEISHRLTTIPRSLRSIEMPTQMFRLLLAKRAQGQNLRILDRMIPSTQASTSDLTLARAKRSQQSQPKTLQIQMLLTESIRPVSIHLRPSFSKDLQIRSWRRLQRSKWEMKNQRFANR